MDFNEISMIMLIMLIMGQGKRFLHFGDSLDSGGT